MEAHFKVAFAWWWSFLTASDAQLFQLRWAQVSLLGQALCLREAVIENEVAGAPGWLCRWCV